MSTPIKPGQLITEIVEAMWDDEGIIECYIILGYEYSGSHYPTTLELNFENKKHTIGWVRKIPDTMEKLYSEYHETTKFIFH